MHKLFKSIIITILLFLVICSNANALFDLTKTSKDKSLNLNSPGDWELQTYEDPITDEITETICKNCGNMPRDYENASEILLGISRNKTTKKTSAYIMSLFNYYKEDVLVKLRFNKEKPEEAVLKYAKIEDEYRLYFNNPLSIIDKLKNSNKFSIFFYNYGDNRIAKEERTIFFDNDTDIFNKMLSLIRR